MPKQTKCCLCEKELTDWGNNPWPLCDADDYESRCCNECNEKYVIPARLDLHFNGKLSTDYPRAKSNGKTQEKK